MDELIIRAITGDSHSRHAITGLCGKDDEAINIVTASTKNPRSVICRGLLFHTMNAGSTSFNTIQYNST